MGYEYPDTIYRLSCSAIIKLCNHTIAMSGHKVFVRHTYIYQCSVDGCDGEWKLNEALGVERLCCPYCGFEDYVDYILEDQRKRWSRGFE